MKNNGFLKAFGLDEVHATIALALPVVIGEVGWMTMGVADTILVSHLGPEAIGAAGIGGSIYFTFAVFGMGLFLGLDTLVAQAIGANRKDEARQWLRTGLLLAILLTPAMMLFFAAVLQTVPFWGLDPKVQPLAEPYMECVLWGTGPLFVYSACRRYLQSVGKVRPVMIVLVTANLVNILGNWVLINGHFGFPRFGVPGSAWATVISRGFLAISLLWIVWKSDSNIFEDNWKRTVRLLDLKRLIQLGLPAATQVTLEVGIFSLAGALVGQMNPVSLAAHQIVLNISSLTFMIPLGISSAAAVRVGHATGAEDGDGAIKAGWSALFLTVAIMILIASCFLLIPSTMISGFTSDSEIIRKGIVLLGIAAVFQIFDGIQSVATGALRGLGDTLTPAICNFFAHWAIGLPVGVYLAFYAGYEVQGIWIGLSTGLIVTGAVLLSVWNRRCQNLHTHTYSS